jgi:hypothetical protein
MAILQIEDFWRLTECILLPNNDLNTYMNEMLISEKKINKMRFEIVTKRTGKENDHVHIRSRRYLVFTPLKEKVGKFQSWLVHNTVSLSELMSRYWKDFEEEKLTAVLARKTRD